MSNELSLKEALKAMIDHYRLKGKLNQSRIRLLWEKLMGPTIAGYTREIRLSGHTLYLSIDSAALRQELAYDKDKIKKILNKELGEDCIREVVVR
jgi:predicted nucleic acid-binding Zn ribbon protein